jgi:hypothetical protein
MSQKIFSESETVFRESYEILEDETMKEMVGHLIS